MTWSLICHSYSYLTNFISAIISYYPTILERWHKVTAGTNPILPFSVGQLTCDAKLLVRKTTLCIRDGLGAKEGLLTRIVYSKAFRYIPLDLTEREEKLNLKNEYMI